MLDPPLTMSTLASSPPLLTPVVSTTSTPPPALDSDEVGSEASTPGMEAQSTTDLPVLEANPPQEDVPKDPSEDTDLSCDETLNQEAIEEEFPRPVFKCADSITHCMMKRNAQVNNADLAKFRINCETCELSFEINELFTHGIEVHQVFTCVCCREVFKFAKELMVHLYREHRVPPQKYGTVGEFFRCGGRDTTLCCVDCNMIFDTPKDSNNITNHECRKNAVMCDLCGQLQLASSLESHKSSCKGTGKMNLEGGTSLSTAQLRNRDNSCKDCGKRFSPSKIAAHVRACSQRLNPTTKLNQENGGSSGSPERPHTTPPVLSREFCKLPVLPSMKMRRKLMPALNPVNPVKRSNGWKTNLPASRSDMEVTLVPDSQQRPSKLSSTSKLDASSNNSPQASRKQLAPTSAFSKEKPMEPQVSITIVPVGDNNASTGSVPVKMNGQISSDSGEDEFEEDEDDRLVIDESYHSSSRVEHPPEISMHPRQSMKPGANRAEKNPHLGYPRALVDPSQQEFMYGGLERPKRTLRKVNHDDFMYENISKRSYQRSHSISSPAPKITILQHGRQRNSLSTSAGASSHLDQNRKPRNQSSEMFGMGNLELKASPGSSLKRLQIKRPDSGSPPVSYSIQSSDDLYSQFESEEDEPDPEVKLDPLLLESDPQKRQQMLIEELAEKLSQEWPSPEMPGYTCTEQDISNYEIVVNYRLEEKIEDDVLAMMLTQTAYNCTYCRQAKLIRIDKRQLAIHLFSKHSWDLKFSPIEKLVIKQDQDEEMKRLEPSSKVEAGDNEPAKSSENNQLSIDNSTEKGDESSKIPEKIESTSNNAVTEISKDQPPAGIDQAGDNVNISDPEKTNNEPVIEESGEKQTNPISGEDQVDAKKFMCTGHSIAQRFRHNCELSEEEEMDIGVVLPKPVVLKAEPPTTAIISTYPQPCDHEEQPPTAEPMDTTDNKVEDKIGLPVPSPDVKLEEPEQIDYNEFKLVILKKVFSSETPVFTYRSPETPQFGYAPCECLICGLSVEIQKSLFSHWRKMHRGVAMKCKMCNGRFLFAGALFSHLCLGTPNPIIKSEVSTVHPNGSGGKNPPHSQISEGHGLGGEVQVVDMKDDDGSMDTILLRYQCGICEDAQLPGFFNYMVHLRKEHSLCELCLETMPSQKELEYHMKKHKLNHFCWKCGVTYCAKPNFMTHLFWKHGSESKDCSKCLKKKWPHIYHFCVPPLSFPCDICGFYFTKPKCLMVHKRLHTGEKMRKCPKHNCTEMFISKKLLQKHIDSVHNPNNPLLAITSGNEVPGSASEDASEDQESQGSQSPRSTIVYKTVEQSDQKTDELKLILQPVLTDVKYPKEDEETNKSVDEGVLNEVKSAGVVSDVSDNEDKKQEASQPREPEKPFNLAEIQGPNLSEDESDSDDMSTSSYASTAKTPKVVSPNILVEEATSAKLNPDEVKSDAPMKPDSTVTNDLNAETTSAANETLNLNIPAAETASKKSNSAIKSGPDSTLISGLSNGLAQSPPPKDNQVSQSAKSLNRVANDLVLSEDSNDNSDSEDESNTGASKNDKELKPKETGGKTAMTNLLDHCENLEKNLNQSAMDIDDAMLDKSDADPFKKVLSLDLNSGSDLLEETDKLKHHDDFGSMSPLLPPLDDFNFNVPDIPTFEENSLPEHIIRENAMFSILQEHDYCLRIATKRRPSSPTSTSPVLSPGRHGTQNLKKEASEGKVKKLKIIKPKKKKSPKKSSHNHSRKRHHSSSSSSSSSSCSSCGSNCSCTSSSSSSSSSSNDDSSSENEYESIRNPVPHQRPYPNSQTPSPVKRGRGRPKGSVNRNKDGVPTAKKKSPGGAGKRIGRLVVPKPPKPPKPPKSEDYSPKRKYRKVKVKFGKKASAHEKENNGGPHPVYPEENYILETDLETDESGSEEAYNHKQLAETIGKIPAVDEIWTMSNEQYLLKFVRGVKDLEELRPAPAPPKPKKLPQYNTYSVKQSGSPESRLKVRNVPIKPLIVKRNIPSSPHPTAQYMYGNTPLIGPRPLKTTVVSNSLKPTIRISREAIPNAATAVPASALLLGDRVNHHISLKSPLKKALPSSQQQPTTAPPAPIPPEEPAPKKAAEPAPAVPIRRPRMKIGTGKGGRKVVSTPAPLAVDSSGNERGASTEPLYCICQSPHDNVSQMIGCDAKECEYQWFHFECVGVTIPPKGKWFCPDCRERRRQKAAEMKKCRTLPAVDGYNNI